MRHIARHFAFPLLLAACALSAVYVLWGPVAFITALLLVLLEATLSFDNAVVNAKVLARMTPLWQHRFITWGIFVAVFVTRLALPVLIVSAVAEASPLFIAHIALFDPAQYAELVEKASYSIHAFGASFLFLVGLKYFLDTEKKVHWIRVIERRLTRWGKVEALETAIVLMVIVAMAAFVPPAAHISVLVAGIAGVVIFVLMRGIMSAFSLEAMEVASTSVALFVYLEILDAAFSLDGVVGAFALTNAIPIIAIGLGIGAYFVRSLTVYMVRQGTLDALVFLEHGAHWAIVGLAVSMFANLVVPVPEFVTGSIGLVVVVAAYYSSLLSLKAGRT